MGGEKEIQAYENWINVLFVVMPVSLTCNNLFHRRKDFGSVYIIVVTMLCYFAGDMTQSLLTGNGVGFLKSESTVLIGVLVCILVIAGGHKLWDFPVWRIMVISATTLSSWNIMYKAFNVGLNDCNTLFAALFLSTLRGVARPLALDFENYVWDRRSPVFHCVIKKSFTSVLYYILSQLYPRDAFLLCTIFSLTADYIHIPEIFGFLTPKKNNENTGPAKSMKQQPPNSETKKTESPEKSESLSKPSSKSKKTESPERSEKSEKLSLKKNIEKSEPVKQQSQNLESESLSPNKSKKLTESAERSDSLSLSSSSNGFVSPKKVKSG